jgi:hypothetical protein
LDAASYAYLLGIYLGDGCISDHPRSVCRLRIALDAIYPGIAAECATAIEAVAPGKRAHLLRRRHERSVEVSSYWKHWPCLIPQHGKGPKHMRPIALTDWQRRIVAGHVERFIRGLIHSLQRGDLIARGERAPPPTTARLAVPPRRRNPRKCRL